MQLVLTILLIEAGRVVSVQDLAERIWDDEPPDRAKEIIQVYVSRLRKSLREAGDRVGLIRSSPAGGYRLDVPPDDVDVGRFEHLLARARAAAAEPDPERARSLLLEAESLHRGQPLEGVIGNWAQATRQALRERLRTTVLARIALDLRLGDRVDDAISELTAMTGTGPIDQKAVALLMNALNMLGRPAEALQVFRRTRARLHSELSLEPRQELQALHQRILRGEPTDTASLGPPAAGAGPAPDTLDRDPPHLVGRDRELSQLLSDVVDDLRAAKSAVVCALDGMPGIGKTALAVHAAHRLRTHCPDGALQINIRTHSSNQPPLDVREALIRLLEAVSTPSAQLGATSSVDDLAALWRRRSSGRRLVILLDDVLDTEQIGPLLPTAPGSVVLLTSRRRLSQLAEARLHTVRLLDYAETSTLLARITGRDFAAETAGLEQFTHCCGGLPLAVTVAAAHLRARPAWRLSDLVKRFTDAVPTAADDSLTGPVHAAFAMSYRALTPAPRTLLRRLAAHPGQDISLHAAAVMAAMPPVEADLALDVLVEHHLVEETSRHRYRLHDLVRAYALAQIQYELDTATTDDAVQGVLDFYLAAAMQAESMLRPHRRALCALSGSTDLFAPPPLAFGTHEAAQMWLDSESANLMAIAVHAQERGRHPHASVLPGVLAQHLDRRGYWSQAVEMLRNAVAADATSRGEVADDAVTAQLLTDLAAAHIRTNTLEEASKCARDALDIWRACGDERGQADALVELGRAHWHARHPADAVEAYEGAVALYDKTGERRGQAVAGYHLGILQFELGRYTAAFAQAREALKAARTLRDPALQSEALATLGEMYQRSGLDGQAFHHLQQAQALAERQGNPHTIAVLASNMGAVQDRLGDHDAALASFNTALRLFRALDDWRNESDAMVHLARAYIRQRDFDTASAMLVRAVELADQADDPLRRAEIHLEAGHLHRARNHNSRAIDSYRASLNCAQQAAAPLDQARAHLALGDLLGDLGESEAAREHHDRAGELYRRLGHSDLRLAPRPDS